MYPEMTKSMAINKIGRRKHKTTGKECEDFVYPAHLTGSIADYSLLRRSYIIGFVSQSINTTSAICNVKLTWK